MKSKYLREVLLSLVLLFPFAVFAQVPQGISYQAIASNSSGVPVVNSNVGIRLSILDNSASGTMLYEETHNKTTNAQGLFNLVIGQGAASFGTFSGINWGTNSTFLKVEIDIAGGSNYTLVGTTQLLSVPYAMYAGNTASVSGSSSINDDIVANKSSNFALQNPNENKVYVFNATLGLWSSQSYVPGLYNIVTSQTNGNFAIQNPNEDKVFAYSGKTNTWTAQSYVSGFSNLIVTATNGNFIVQNPNENKIYAFNGKTAVWSVQSYVSGMSNVSVLESNGNFAVHNPNESKVYVYNSKMGNWTSQTYLAGMSNIVLTASNGNFILSNPNESKVYAYSGQIGTWSAQSYVSGFSNITITPSQGN